MICYVNKYTVTPIPSAARWRCSRVTTRERSSCHSAAQAGYSGIVINPGAYAHYSYAIYDALRAADVPAVEVHISDITGAGAVPAVSVTAAACVKTICGHGLAGYLEAMDYLMATASDRSDSAAPHAGCGGAACV